MVIVLTKRFEVVLDDGFVIFPTRVFGGIGIFVDLKQFNLFGPAVKIKRPDAIGNIYVVARHVTVRTNVDALKTLTVVKLHKHVSQDMACTRRKESPILAGPT